MGITLARKCGLKIIWVTGSSTPAIQARGKMLGVYKIMDGCANKGIAMDEIVAELGINYDEIAFIGDDLNDMLAMKKAGYSCCVSNAVDEVKSICDFVTKKHGGDGAVREVIEHILKAQGKWDNIVENFENYTFAQKKIVQ